MILLFCEQQNNRIGETQPPDSLRSNDDLQCAPHIHERHPNQYQKWCRESLPN